jgi:multiple antibiotic resistance protein
MPSYFSFEGLWISIITIFVIMDPVASIPPFIALTKKFPTQDVKWAAKKSVMIAGALAGGFMLVGPAVLGVMGITLHDFRVAGGLVLGILALEMVLGISFKESKESAGQPESRSAVAMLIATPMLTGPGLMSSMVLLSREYGHITVMLGLLPALLAAYFVLSNSGKVRRMMGEQVLEVTSRLMGMLLLALAVAFVRAGLAA